METFIMQHITPVHMSVAVNTHMAVAVNVQMAVVVDVQVGTCWAGPPAVRNACSPGKSAGGLG